MRILASSPPQPSAKPHYAPMSAFQCDVFVECKFHIVTFGQKQRKEASKVSGLNIQLDVKAKTVSVAHTLKEPDVLEDTFKCSPIENSPLVFDECILFWNACSFWKTFIFTAVDEKTHFVASRFECTFNLPVSKPHLWQSTGSAPKCVVFVTENGQFAFVLEVSKELVFSFGRLVIFDTFPPSTTNKGNLRKFCKTISVQNGSSLVAAAAEDCSVFHDIEMRKPLFCPKRFFGLLRAKSRLVEALADAAADLLLLLSDDMRLQIVRLSTGKPLTQLQIRSFSICVVNVLWFSAQRLLLLNFGSCVTIVDVGEAMEAVQRGVKKPVLRERLFSFAKQNEELLRVVSPAAAAAPFSSAKGAVFGALVLRTAAAGQSLVFRLFALEAASLSLSAVPVSPLCGSEAAAECDDVFSDARGSLFVLRRALAISRIVCVPWASLPALNLRCDGRLLLDESADCCAAFTVRRFLKLLADAAPFEASLAAQLNAPHLFAADAFRREVRLLFSERLFKQQQQQEEAAAAEKRSLESVWLLAAECRLLSCITCLFEEAATFMDSFQSVFGAEDVDTMLLHLQAAFSLHLKLLFLAIVAVKDASDSLLVGFVKTLYELRRKIDLLKAFGVEAVAVVGVKNSADVVDFVAACCAARIAEDTRRTLRLVSNALDAYWVTLGGVSIDRLLLLQGVCLLRLGLPSDAVHCFARCEPEAAASLAASFPLFGDGSEADSVARSSQETAHVRFFLALALFLASFGESLGANFFLKQIAPHEVRCLRLRAYFCRELLASSVGIGNLLEAACVLRAHHAILQTPGLEVFFDGVKQQQRGGGSIPGREVFCMVYACDADFVYEAMLEASLFESLISVLEACDAFQRAASVAYEFSMDAAAKGSLVLRLKRVKMALFLLQAVGNPSNRFLLFPACRLAFRGSKKFVDGGGGDCSAIGTIRSRDLTEDCLRHEISLFEALLCSSPRDLGDFGAPFDVQLPSFVEAVMNAVRCLLARGDFETGFVLLSALGKTQSQHPSNFDALFGDFWRSAARFYCQLAVEAEAPFRAFVQQSLCWEVGFQKLFIGAVVAENCKSFFAVKWLCSAFFESFIAACFDVHRYDLLNEAVEFFVASVKLRPVRPFKYCHRWRPIGAVWRVLRPSARSGLDAFLKSLQLLQ